MNLDESSVFLSYPLDLRKVHQLARFLLMSP
jgi:hypothetical protein